MDKTKEMTPEEINKAVARKLGRPAACSHCKGAWEKHQGEMWAKACTCSCHTTNYCSSIAAAWEIVEKFKEYQIEKLKGPTEYYVRLGNVGDKLWAKSETAPMAICLAFLKLP